ncbi:hypothetical protein Esti_006239 [Eimeria stiedai]
MLPASSLSVLHLQQQQEKASVGPFDVGAPRRWGPLLWPPVGSLTHELKPSNWEPPTDCEGPLGAPPKTASTPLIRGVPQATAAQQQRDLEQQQQEGHQQQQERQQQQQQQEGHRQQKAKEKKGAAACRTPVRVSAELQQLLLLPPVSSRVDVVRRLWAYVKQQHLQQEGARHTVRCDPPLQRLFGGLQVVNLFRDINTLLLPHLIYDTADAAAIDAAAAADGDAADGAPRKKEVKGEGIDAWQTTAAGGRQGRVRSSSCSSSSRSSSCSSSSRSSSCSNSSSADASEAPSGPATDFTKRPSRRGSSSGGSSSRSRSNSAGAFPSEALPDRATSSSSSSSAGRRQASVNAAPAAGRAAGAQSPAAARSATAAAAAAAADASDRPRLRRLLLSSSDEEKEGNWAPLLPPRQRAAATSTAAAVTSEAAETAARAAREAAGLAQRTREHSRCPPRASVVEGEQKKEQRQQQQQQQQHERRQQQHQAERKPAVVRQNERKAAAEPESHTEAAWGRWIDEGDDPMLQMLQAAVCRRVGEALLEGRLTFQLLLQQLPAAVAAATADGAAVGPRDASTSKNLLKPYLLHAVDQPFPMQLKRGPSEELRLEGALDLTGLDQNTPYKLTLQACVQQQQQRQQQQRQQRQRSPPQLVKSEAAPTATAGPATAAAATTPAASAAAGAAGVFVLGSVVMEQRRQIAAWCAEACQTFAKGLSIPPLAPAFEAWDVRGPLLLELGSSELSTLGIRDALFQRRFFEAREALLKDE